MSNHGDFLSDYEIIVPKGLGEAAVINDLTKLCHEANRRWWHQDVSQNNPGEKLMLIVSELAEAMEGLRKDLDDDKLTHRKMVVVELADTLIRLLDFAGAYKYDLGGAFVEKLAYNATRKDHSDAERAKEHGKRF